jgi:hypothetical protein
MGDGDDATTRKPRLPVVLSAVFPLRASTRNRQQ